MGKGIFMREGIRRVGVLDDIRGLCVVLMVGYHALYDLVDIFGMDVPLFRWPIIGFARTLVAATFMFIAGITCRFSRSNWKRGGVALLAALALTAGTLLVMPSQQIWFGVLHFMGTAMLLFALLEPLLSRASVPLGVGACVFLFLLTYGIEWGVLGLPGLVTFPLPAGLYRVGWLFPLGFCAPGFFSADYYPLLPWIFVFLAGSYVGIPLRDGRGPDWCYPTRSRALTWVGRHAILIYLLHQPVLYVCFQLFIRLVG